MLAASEPDSTASDVESTLELVFLTIFTVEMILKIIAICLVMSKNTYLEDSWSILDFLVVVFGWISILIGGNNISAIRTLRILRPLRTINFLRGLRILVQSILKSLPRLFDVIYSSSS